MKLFIVVLILVIVLIAGCSSINNPTNTTSSTTGNKLLGTWKWQNGATAMYQTFYENGTLILQYSSGEPGIQFPAIILEYEIINQSV